MSDDAPRTHLDPPANDRILERCDRVRVCFAFIVGVVEHSGNVFLRGRLPRGTRCSEPNKSLPVATVQATRGRCTRDAARSGRRVGYVSRHAAGADLAGSWPLRSIISASPTSLESTRWWRRQRRPDSPCLRQELGDLTPDRGDPSTSHADSFLPQSPPSSSCRSPTAASDGAARLCCIVVDWLCFPIYEFFFSAVRGSFCSDCQTVRNRQFPNRPPHRSSPEPLPQLSASKPSRFTVAVLVVPNQALAEPRHSRLLRFNISCKDEELLLFCAPSLTRRCVLLCLVIFGVCMCFLFRPKIWDELPRETGQDFGKSDRR